MARQTGTTQYGRGAQQVRREEQEETLSAYEEARRKYAAQHAPAMSYEEAREHYAKQYAPAMSYEEARQRYQNPSFMRDKAIESSGLDALLRDAYDTYSAAGSYLNSGQYSAEQNRAHAEKLRQMRDATRKEQAYFQRYSEFFFAQELAEIQKTLAELENAINQAEGSIVRSATAQAEEAARRETVDRYLPVYQSNTQSPLTQAHEQQQNGVQASTPETMQQLRTQFPQQAGETPKAYEQRIAGIAQFGAQNAAPMGQLAQSAGNAADYFGKPEETRVAGQRYGRDIGTIYREYVAAYDDYVNATEKPTVPAGLLPGQNKNAAESAAAYRETDADRAEKQAAISAAEARMQELATEMYLVENSTLSRAGAVTQNDDFSVLSLPQKEMLDNAISSTMLTVNGKPSAWTPAFQLGRFGGQQAQPEEVYAAKYAYINDETVRRLVKESYDVTMQGESARIGDERYHEIYDYWSVYQRMTPEEIKIYNYLYNKSGGGEAERYLQALVYGTADGSIESLTEREAKARAEEYGQPIKRVLYSMEQTLANRFNNISASISGEVQPLSINERATSEMHENADWWGKTVMNASGSLAGMLPSMLASIAGGPVAGFAAGVANYGADSYQRAQRPILEGGLGMGRGSALAYGLLSGASEAGLETLLSGIPGLRGVMTEKAAGKLASRFSNSVARTAAKFGGRFASELIEEQLQNYLDPLFVTALTGRDYEAPGWDELWETTLSVLLLTGATNAPTMAADVQMENFEAQMEWAESALQFEESSEVYKAGQKISDILQTGEAMPGSEFRKMIRDLGAPQKEMAKIREDMAKAQAGEEESSVDEADMETQREEAEQFEAEGQEQIPSVAQEGQTAQELLAAAPAALVKANAVGKTAAPEYGGEMPENERIAAGRSGRDTAQNRTGGMEDAREGAYDGHQRNEGVDTQGQSGAVAEGAGGQVAGGSEQAQRNSLARTGEAGTVHQRSAKEIGVRGGTEEKTLYVLPESEVEQNQTLAKLQADARAHGKNVVLVRGKLSVKNSVGGISNAEGLRQENADGSTTYYIRTDARGANAEQIYMHEEFHDVIAGNREVLLQLVGAMAEQYNQQERAALVNSYVEAYDGAYGRFTEEMSEEECEALELRYLEEMFADLYAGRRRGRTASVAKKARRILENLRGKVDASRENARGMRNQNAPPGGSQYSIHYDERNRPFVRVEEDILENLPREKWIGKVKEILAEKFPSGVRIGNNEIKINRQTRREMTFSEYTKRLAKNDRNVYADKFRAASHADEILLASREYINEGIKHARKDNIRDFARGTVLLQVGNADYTADVVVGTTKRGDMLLYDIVNLQRAEIKERSRHTVPPNQTESDRSGTPASDKTIAQGNENVKQKFSMDDSVEEVGTLLAVHNLTEENLEKAYELGGFAMPSIAVVRAEMGHKAYGEVSVVFPKTTIDPQANSDNRIYGGDAYTTSFPIGDEPRTVEDAVNKMREAPEHDGDRVEDTFFGAAHRAFDSIDDVHEDEGRIERGDAWVYDSQRSDIQSRFTDICYEHEGTGGYGETAKALSEAVAQSKTLEELEEKLQKATEEQLEYSTELAPAVWELVEEIRQMPTEYFEAKPRRAVKFDEVAAAIVPDDMDDFLRQKLEWNGLNVLQYPAGDEGARLKALNSLPELRFSVEETPDSGRENVTILGENENIYGNSIAKSSDERYNRIGRSQEASDIIRRLGAGEDIPLSEVMRIPEVRVAVEASKGTETISIPGREQLREDAFQTALLWGSWNGKEYKGAVRRKKRMDIVLGLPGSGKSSVYTERISREHGSRVIDTDDYRELIPEYNGLNSPLVHEEASLIRNRIRDYALDKGENIILSIIGANANKLTADIKRYSKEEGYAVYLHLNELPNGKAIGRALGRFIGEDGTLGRFVDPRLVAAYEDHPTRTYLLLTGGEKNGRIGEAENGTGLLGEADAGGGGARGQNGHGVSRTAGAATGTASETAGILAGWDRYSNDVPFGEKPRLIESSEAARFSVEDEAAELDERFRRTMAGEIEPERDPERMRDGTPLDTFAEAELYEKGRAEKEHMAQTASLTTLKSRIERSERKMQVNREALRSVRNAGMLSPDMEARFDRQMSALRETLEIDRAALRKKQAEKTATERKQREKKKKQEAAQRKAQMAQRELRTDLMNLFSVRGGERLAMGEKINAISDKLLHSGRLTNEDRTELFDALYEHGEERIAPDEMYQSIRESVREGRIYVPEEVRSEFGDDWENFRRRAWGSKIYLTSNRLDAGIDVWTDDLRSTFAVWNLDATADLRAQLEAIVELAEEGRTERVTIAEAMLRNQDNYGWSVEEQTEELRQKVDRILETFAQKADIEIRLRERSMKKLLAEQERRMRQAEANRELREENAIRTRVLHSIQRLSKMQKKAAPEMQREIDLTLKNIDTLARRITPTGIENLQALAQEYYETKEELGEAFIPNDYVEERIHRLGKTRLDNMPLSDVVELGKVVSGLVATIHDQNKMLASKRRAYVSETAAQVQTEIEESKGKGSGKISDFFQEHLDAKRFFGKISGWQNGATEALARELSDGQERMMDYQRRAMRLFDEFLSEKENQKWVKSAAGKSAEWVKVEAQGAEIVSTKGTKATSSLELTPMMRVSLLMHSRNKDNLWHIGHYVMENGTKWRLAGGGITLPDKKLYRKGNMKEAYARGMVVRIPPETVKSIARSCTAQERAFADILAKYFDAMARDSINEVSVVLDGFERATRDNYFPIESDKTFIATENELVKQDLSLTNFDWLKERNSGAQNPIYLTDASAVLTRSVDQVSKYAGLALPIRDVKAVLNSTYYSPRRDTESQGKTAGRTKIEGWGALTRGSVKNTISRKWGNSATEYINKLLADLQKPERNSDTLSGFLEKLRGKYARAVISANLSSVMKQTASYPVALPYLGTKALAYGLTHKLGKSEVKTLEKYSAVYWYRNQGNATTELRDAMGKRSFAEKLPFGYGLTQRTDSLTTRRLLAACEYAIQSETGLTPGTQEDIDAGTDRYWQEVAERFNTVVMNTQSNSSIMERPQITRANSSNVSRFLTMFRTDAFQQYNMIVEAQGRLRTAEQAYKQNPSAENRAARTAARQFVRRTHAGILVGQSMVAMVTMLIRAFLHKEDFRDEDDDIDFLEIFSRFGRNIVEGYMGFIVGADILWSGVDTVIDRVKGESGIFYGPEVSSLEMVTDLFSSVIDMTETLLDRDWNSLKGEIKRLAFLAAQMFGVPIGNIEKYVLAAVKWVSPESAERWENLWQETTKASLSRELKHNVAAAIGVIMDNRTEATSDENKEEIARLYAIGLTAAVPSGIPTTISYTLANGDRVETVMSAPQQEDYRELWNTTVSSALNELMGTKEYASATDEEKAELISTLYRYAAQIAKHSIDGNAELDKWVAQGENALNKGIALEEYILFYTEIGDIDGTDDSGESVSGLASAKKIAALEGMGWTAAQEEAVYRDALASESKTKNLDALKKAGLSWEQANDVLAALKTSDAVKKIYSLNVSDKVKAEALMVYVGDTEKKMIRTGVRFGVRLEWYQEVKSSADADGSGRVDQKEATDYIRQMGLGYQDSAYLWQMVTDGKEGKSNPFSQTFGEEFWLQAHMDDEVDEDE